MCSVSWSTSPTGGRARSPRARRAGAGVRDERARSRWPSPRCRRARSLPRCSAGEDVRLAHQLGNVVAMPEDCDARVAEQTRRGGPGRPAGTRRRCRNLPVLRPGSAATPRARSAGPCGPQQRRRRQSSGLSARARLRRAGRTRLVVAVDVPRRASLGESRGRGSLSRSPRGRGGSRRARTPPPPWRRIVSVVRVLVVGRQRHTEALAILAHDLVGEARVRVRALEHRGDARAARGAQRLVGRRAATCGRRRSCRAEPR